MKSADRFWKRARWPGMLALCLLAALSTAGCRQNPSEEPKYYARELEQMRREEMRAATAKSEQALKDGYPWRGKTRENPCLPCRIQTTEKEITTEIKYLHETIHGRKKTRLKFRD